MSENTIEEEQTPGGPTSFTVETPSRKSRSQSSSSSKFTEKSSNEDIEGSFCSDEIDPAEDDSGDFSDSESVYSSFSFSASHTSQGSNSTSASKSNLSAGSASTSKSTLSAMSRKCAYKCDFPACSVAFSRPSRLEQHKRTHTGEVLN